MLSMLTTWIGFAKIEHLFTASRVKDLLSKEDLLGYIVHQYCDANHTPFLESVDGQLAIVMKGALKLRALVTFLADVVVRYESSSSYSHQSRRSAARPYGCHSPRTTSQNYPMDCRYEPRGAS